VKANPPSGLAGPKRPASEVKALAVQTRFVPDP